MAKTILTGGSPGFEGDKAESVMSGWGTSSSLHVFFYEVDEAHLGLYAISFYNHYDVYFQKCGVVPAEYNTGGKIAAMDGSLVKPFQAVFPENIFMGSGYLAANNLVTALVQVDEPGVITVGVENTQDTHEKYSCRIVRVQEV